MDFNNYHKLRLENLLIDGAYDLFIDKSYILEFGYDKLNAIDFEKGCYVGQEVITRTYRRGVIRKSPRLIEFVEGFEKGDDYVVDGKKIGVVCL